MCNFVIPNVAFLSGEVKADVCVRELTNVLIFPSVWFYCNKKRDSPSVSVMRSVVQEATLTTTTWPHPLNMTQCELPSPPLTLHNNTEPFFYIQVCGFPT